MAFHWPTGSGDQDDKAPERHGSRRQLSAEDARRSDKNAESTRILTADESEVRLRKIPPAGGRSPRGLGVLGDVAGRALATESRQET